MCVGSRNFLFTLVPLCQFFIIYIFITVWDVTFGSTCQRYVDYVHDNYRDPTFVFDGYEACPSTKYIAYKRRSKEIVGTQVNFVKEMYLKTKKEMFLVNTTNKQKFIHMLIAKLQEKGMKIVHAAGDADVLIRTTSVNLASMCPTTLIGEDTDLLVLLCMQPNQKAGKERAAARCLRWSRSSSCRGI